MADARPEWHGNVVTRPRRRRPISCPGRCATKTDACVRSVHSIRTSFDLFLTALNLPRGSEIIFSSVTIKDMVRQLQVWRARAFMAHVSASRQIVIAKHHGLVPVPLDLDTATMSPRSELLQRAFSPKTRVLVVAHIFGARLDMTPWVRRPLACASPLAKTLLRTQVKMAREKGVIMVDDCAEVFEGYPVYSGHPDADLSLFSFGSIKARPPLLLLWRGHILTDCCRRALRWAVPSAACATALCWRACVSCIALTLFAAGACPCGALLRVLTRALLQAEFCEAHCDVRRVAHHSGAAVVRCGGARYATHPKAARCGVGRY